MSKCPWARYWTPNCSWCAGDTLHGGISEARDSWDWLQQKPLRPHKRDKAGTDDGWMEVNLFFFSYSSFLNENIIWFVSLSMTAKWVFLGFGQKTIFEDNTHHILHTFFLKFYEQIKQLISNWENNWQIIRNTNHFNEVILLLLCSKLGVDLKVSCVGTATKKKWTKLNFRLKLLHVQADK